MLLLSKVAVCSQCILRAEFVQYTLIGWTGACIGHTKDPVRGAAVTFV